MAGRFWRARQAGNRHADDDGVVAGQRDVDHDHLRQSGEVVGQRDLVHAAAALVSRRRGGLAGLPPATGQGSDGSPLHQTRDGGHLGACQPLSHLVRDRGAGRRRRWRGSAPSRRAPRAAIREKGGAKVAAISQADIERIDAIERETRHDVIAFLTWLAEAIGEDSRFVHLGMTSSDVLDTCLSVQLTQAADLLLRTWTRCWRR